MTITFNETLNHYSTCECGRGYPLVSMVKQHELSAVEDAQFELHNRPLCNMCIRKQKREDEFGIPKGKS